MAVRFRREKYGPEPIRGLSFANRYFIGEDLSGLTFVGCDFRNAHIRRCNLHFTQFIDCLTDGIVIDDCDISGSTSTSSPLVFAGQQLFDKILLRADLQTRAVKAASESAGYPQFLTEVTRRFRRYSYWIVGRSVEDECFVVESEWTKVIEIFSDFASTFTKTIKLSESLQFEDEITSASSIGGKLQALGVAAVKSELKRKHSEKRSRSMQVELTNEFSLETSLMNLPRDNGEDRPIVRQLKQAPLYRRVRYEIEERSGSDKLRFTLFVLEPRMETASMKVEMFADGREESLRTDSMARKRLG
jgi:Pentapeptide repeats (8 copies)